MNKSFHNPLAAESDDLDMSLSINMKKSFNDIRIKNLNTPDLIDDYVEEKFQREKNDVAITMKNLNFQISKLLNIESENYKDNNKLAMDVFEDFERQESWLSYSTLLFADVNKK